MGEIFRLPSCTIRTLDRLPAGPGIYYLTAGWRILYVGKSRNLRARWRNHHRYQQFAALHPLGRLHYRSLPAPQITAYEAQEIQRLHPRWNQRKVPGLWGVLRLRLQIWGQLGAYTVLGGSLGGLLYSLLRSP
ncbi:MAG: GIY-YIG nuclease family protein [Pseudanabaenaceae cyanobacterium]